MTEALVIVGAGHAAGQLVSTLAQEGFPGSVTILGDEAYVPYQRPPLSKKFLAGELGLDRLFIKPAEFYDRPGIALRVDTKVERIDRVAGAVITATGAAIGYSKLVVATGSRPRKLALPGAGLDGLFYLRTVDDVLNIQSRFAAGRRLVIVGGGYIGLELAAVAVKAGLDVTVLEEAPRIMGRGVGPVVSSFYQRIHQEAGVRIATETAVVGFEGDTAVTRVICSNAGFAADIVVIGVGAVPNVELAEQAGLAVDNGILVDEFCRTSDAAIYAVGDCTNHPNALSNRRLRLESVHNAVEQAKTAAAGLCGRPVPYTQVPWFWSDQYDVKLQIAGLSAGHDEAVVRGDPAKGRSFAVFYLKDGVLIGVDAVNRPQEFMMSKILIAEKTRLDPARLGDERIGMKEMRK